MLSLELGILFYCVIIINCFPLVGEISKIAWVEYRIAVGRLSKETWAVGKLSKSALTVGEPSKSVPIVGELSKTLDMVGEISNMSLCCMT